MTDSHWNRTGSIHGRFNSSGEKGEPAATRAQVIAATQSVTLVNQLVPEDVWVVDRNRDGASEFRHLKKEDISAWLDDYALGELWEKNLLGGRP